MNKLLKWEHKKILAMALAWIMIFNLLAGIGMSAVYAEGSPSAEPVVVDIPGTNNTQAGGTNDGSETISGSDVSGNQQNVTGNDVSSGEAGVSFLNVGVGDVPVFDEDGMVAKYRTENGQNHIYVSGTVSSLMSLSKMTWSTSSSANTGTAINYSGENGKYTFSFSGTTYSYSASIYLHATNSLGRTKSLELKIASAFDIDEDVPSVSQVNIKSSLVATEAGNYSNGAIKMEIEASDATGVAQYVIKTGETVDSLSDSNLASSTSSEITIQSLPIMSKLWVLVKDSVGNWSQAVEIGSVAFYNEEELDNSWMNCVNC